METMFESGARVHHVKTGKRYTIDGTPDAVRIEAGNVPAYSYIGSDEIFWVRPKDEMEDGRFLSVEGSPEIRLVLEGDTTAAQVGDNLYFAEVCKLRVGRIEISTRFWVPVDATGCHLRFAAILSGLSHVKGRDWLRSDVDFRHLSIEEKLNLLGNTGCCIANASRQLTNIKDFINFYEGFTLVLAKSIGMAYSLANAISEVEAYAEDLDMICTEVEDLRVFTAEHIIEDLVNDRLDIALVPE